MRGLVAIPRRARGAGVSRIKGEPGLFEVQTIYLYGRAKPDLLDMKNTLVWFLLLTMGSFWIASPASSSQIANHIRVAMLAYEDARTPRVIKEILEYTLNYYKAGAAGPDVFDNIEGTLHLVRKTSHYESTGKLIQNMLRLSLEEFSDELKTRFAYTLGWITHYYLDTEEHKVVNRYGGYYEIDHGRHKNLEMFETAHIYVFEQPDPRGAPDHYIAPWSRTITEFLNRAFGETYPGIGRQIRQILGIQETAWNITRDLDFAGAGMERFTRGTVGDFIADTPGSTWVTTTTNTLIGPLPARSEYSRLLRPLEVSVPKLEIRPSARVSGKNALLANVDYVVNDDTLFVGYISDWYEANQKALDNIVAIFKTIAAQLCDPDPDCSSYSAKWRGRVFPMLPDYNMDTGELEGSAGQTKATQDSYSFQRRNPTLELKWEILDSRDTRILEGKPTAISLTGLRTENESAYLQIRRGTVPIEVDDIDRIVGAGNGPFRFKAVLRILTNDTYATAFKFPKPESARTEPLRKEKVPIEASDEWNILFSTASVNIELRLGRPR